MIAKVAHHILEKLNGPRKWIDPILGKESIFLKSLKGSKIIFGKDLTVLDFIQLISRGRVKVGNHFQTLFSFLKNNQKTYSRPFFLRYFATFNERISKALD